MLNELIAYADTQMDAPEPGFKPKQVRWAIEFTSDGQFIKITEVNYFKNARTSLNRKL